jgi:hypothetical protein
MLTDRDYDLISAYLDDALEGDDLRAVEQRLATDPAFAAEVAVMRRVVALIHDLPELAAPRDFRLTREQASRIDRERAASTTPKPRLGWVQRYGLRVVSAAASTILLVAGFVGLMQANTPRTQNLSGGEVAMAAETLAPTPEPLMTTVATEEMEAMSDEGAGEDADTLLFQSQPAPDLAATADVDVLPMAAMVTGQDLTATPAEDAAFRSFALPEGTPAPQTFEAAPAGGMGEMPLATASPLPSLAPPVAAPTSAPPVQTDAPDVTLGQTPADPPAELPWGALASILAGAVLGLITVLGVLRRRG